MGLPAKRRTSRSKKERAAHFALGSTSLAKCEKCSSVALPHRACGKCGTYRGKTAVNVEKRTARLKRHVARTK